jgi:diguanylate cyclase (GGDEF)-like protein/PAS domain S-box-containing protein
LRPTVNEAKSMIRPRRTGDRPSARRFALVVSLVYAALAAIWIPASDQVLASLTSDVATLSTMQTWKGWAFVALTSLFLYLVVLHRPADPVSDARGDDRNGDRRFQRIVATAVGGLIAVILANLIYTLAKQRQEILFETEVRTQNLVRVIEEQTRGGVDAVDVTLASTARAMQLLPGRSEPRNADILALLRANLRSLPFVRAIWVLDSSGTMIHHSDNLPGKFNLSDREYFHVHRDSADAGGHIDPPLLGIQGIWFVPISRRIENPDRTFAGVIVAALEPTYFERFYGSIAVRKGGVLGLALADGTLVARAPAVEALRGKKVEPPPPFVNLLATSDAGTYRAISSEDGVERITSYRKIKDRPLVVFLGLSTAESLAGWHRAAMANGLASLAFVLVFVWLGYLTLRELRRRSLLNHALRESESRIRNLFEQAADGIFIITAENRYVEANAEGLRMYGYSREEFLRLGVSDILAEHERDRRPAGVSRMMAGAPHLQEWTHVRKDGTTFPAEVSARPLAEGQYLVIVRDLTARREAERETRRAFERFEKIFLAAPEAMSIGDMEGGRLMLVNDAFCETFGYTREELLAPASIESGLWTDVTRREEIITALRDGRTVRGMEGQIRRRSGELRDVLCSGEAIEFGNETRLLLMFSDITERKRADEHIKYLATHDSLTDLPNRNLILDRITQAIAHTRRTGGQLALVYLDLDRFKVINDGFGHPFGDAMLKAVAERLCNAVREGDTVARHSGDEFMILLANLRKTTDVYIVTQKIIETFVRPFALEGRETYLTASIGVSIFPQDGDNADALIAAADAAMYHSKGLGRNTFRFFTREMSEETQRRFDLETGLRGAIAQDQLHLEYQPKVDLGSGRITGCEALLRWTHPEFGAVSPGRFIPIAEDSGLIVPIGDWVLRTACAQNKAWQDAGLPPISVSVNVSARQFLKQDVVAWVMTTLKATGLPADWLELELTEGLIAQDTEKVIAAVNQLKTVGVKFSIDDFGTGYSSLSYLKNFRVDSLKIDQSFVRNMLTQPDDAAIVRGVISLAHSLKLKVVAEGVETAEQSRFLRLNRCDELQGFYFGRPVPASEFAALLGGERRLDLQA